LKKLPRWVIIRQRSNQFKKGQKMVKPHIEKAKARIKNTDDVKARMTITYNRENVADVRIGSIQIARLDLDENDMKDPEKAIRDYLKPSHYSDALTRFNRANKKRLQSLKRCHRAKKK